MLTFFLLSLAHAATYTVDPSGGGDATTIEAGLALLEDGDTLIVAAGTYDVRSLVLYEDDITLEGAGWESTTFDGGFGGAFSNAEFGMAIEGQGVTVRGIGFQDYLGATAVSAVKVDGSASFEGCAFIGNHLGIRQHYYYLANIAVYNSIFAQNDFAIYTEFWLDTLRVESSLFIDNEYGVLFSGYSNPTWSAFDQISVVNNTFVGGTYAISVGNGYGEVGKGDYELYVVNNLFSTSRSAWGVGLDAYPGVSGEIRNNVYAPGVVSSYPIDAIPETDNLEAEPAFVAWSDDGDWTNDDLRLLAGSPAIDAGVDGYATWATDLDGLDRALDGDGDGLALPDAGAYEYCPPELCPADTGAPGVGDIDSPSEPAWPTDASTPSSPFGCATVRPAGGAVGGLALALATLLGRRRRAPIPSARFVGRPS